MGLEEQDGQFQSVLGRLFTVTVMVTTKLG